MKQQIAIIAQSFINPKESDVLNIGGVETWLMELVRLLSDLGYAPVIYQTSIKDFLLKIEGAEIIGLGGLDRHKMTHLSHRDIDFRQIKNIIYASSFVGEKEFRKGQIFIQHGIHWDYTTSSTDIKSRLKWEFIRRKLSRHDFNMCKEARMTITVDSNFLNQARIKLRHHFRPGKIHFIPNFAEPQEKSLWSTKWHNPQEINILFARRFEFRRGVTIFAEAIEQILDKAPNVNVTFAGWGSHYDYLFEKFKNSKRVLIQAIPHHEINNHFNRSHIAVIPSTYSEGTSLSCLEAMASGCAVISSDVGGLCNLVLPDYNGLLIRPLAQEIEDALNKLINNLPLAEEIANRGYDTVCKTFSIFNWRQRIQQALAEAGIPDLSK